MVFRFIKKLFGLDHGKSETRKIFNQSPNISSDGLTRHYYDSEELEQLHMKQLISKKNSHESSQQLLELNLNELENLQLRLQELDELQELEKLQEINQINTHT